MRDGQLAHQGRRGLDVDHDPSPASRGPPASAIVAANHAACSSGGSPVAKWYAIRTRKPAARMPAQLAANCGSRSPMPSVAFAATSWMLSTPRTALQSTVPSQWETSIPSRRGIGNALALRPLLARRLYVRTGEDVKRPEATRGATPVVTERRTAWLDAPGR